MTLPMRTLRRRYGRSGKSEKTYTVEIRWAGYNDAVYKTVHAKTEAGAEKAAMYAAMRAAAETGRDRASKVIVHDDSGSKAEHFNYLRGLRSK